MPTTDNDTAGAIRWDIPLPSLIADNDPPRARLSDPITSHRAADRSQGSRRSVRHAVLELVEAFESLTGEEINGLYQSREHFPAARYDSPRKRAGELAAEGFLHADRANGLEALYTLTHAGRALLAGVQS